MVIVQPTVMYGMDTLTMTRSHAIGSDRDETYTCMDGMGQRRHDNYRDNNTCISRRNLLEVSCVYSRDPTVKEEPKLSVRIYARATNI